MYGVGFCTSAACISGMRNLDGERDYKCYVVKYCNIVNVI